MLNYVLLLFMTLMGAFAGFFLKKTSEDISPIKMLKNRNFYFGGILYFISALINIYILRELPYSFVLPMTSITYIWTMIISNKFLDEKVSKIKIFGVVLVLIGAITITI